MRSFEFIDHVHQKHWSKTVQPMKLGDKDSAKISKYNYMWFLYYPASVTSSFVVHQMNHGLYSVYNRHNTLVFDYRKFAIDNPGLQVYQ